MCSQDTTPFLCSLCQDLLSHLKVQNGLPEKKVILAGKKEIAGNGFYKLQFSFNQHEHHTLYTLEKKPLPINSTSKFSQNSSFLTAVRSLCQRSSWQ